MNRSLDDLDDAYRPNTARVQNRETIEKLNLSNRYSLNSEIDKQDETFMSSRIYEKSESRQF
jgi:hypothetical protein